ncbi:MAG TPA: amidohydrolase family protein [Gemmataceae bacterium]|nr:amidohydrolase family protein [Gemmataceae bacterium]
MSQPLDRRAFLQQGAAAATLAAAGLAADKEKDVLPIIDTHQHLWDLKKFRLPWLKRAAHLDRSYLMEDYLKAAAELARSKAEPPARIVKTVYMEVDLAPEQQQAEADYVRDICEGGKTPMVAAVVSGRPNSDGFAKYARQFKDSPYIKGIRQVLHGPDTPAGYCLDKRFIAGIRLLGELGLSFDLCMRPQELPDAAKLIDACPDTRFILDHCGNADVQARDRTRWKKDMAAVAKRKNVVGKVSGIVATAKPGAWTADDLAPIVNHTLEVFGPDRVMFGGDWPVCTKASTLAQWVEALRAVVKDRKAEEQRKLFHDNAVRVYRLG